MAVFREPNGIQPTYMKLLTDQVSFRPTNMCTGCAKLLSTSPGKNCFFVRKAPQLLAMLSLGHQPGDPVFLKPNVVCFSRNSRRAELYVV